MRTWSQERGDNIGEKLPFKPDSPQTRVERKHTFSRRLTTFIYTPLSWPAVIRPHAAKASSPPQENGYRIERLGLRLMRTRLESKASA
jgi:hypothetical protein